MAQDVLDEPRLTVEVVPKEARQHTRIVKILREALLLGVLFAFYSVGRYVAARHSGAAFTNAELVVDVERALGLPSEVELQRETLSVPDLPQAANGYYALVHFPLTIAVLLWLSLRRPAAYPRVRWAMVALTGMAAIGHLAFPLAPPRMLPQLGFVDTGVRYGQSVYGAKTDGGIANQFAAMPSLHVGWAAMIAVVMILVTRSRWRWLWVLHPVVTFAVVVVTANHYWLDGLVALILVVCCLPLLGPAVRRLAGDTSVPSGADQSVGIHRM
jgi:PAP2 superfamily